ncbi:BatD family protein [bacterium]|nr:BatD family protein [bacterium]
MKKLLGFILIIFLFCQFSYAQDLVLNAFTDKQQIKVGEPLEFSLKITAKKNLKFNYPNFQKAIGKFEVIEPAKIKVDSSSTSETTTTITYKLTAFETGEAKIPPINVNFFALPDTTENSLASNSIPISIASTLNPQEQQNPADIEEPVQYPFDWMLLALWISGGLILIALIFWLYKKWKAKQIKHEPEKIEIKDSRTPWQKAMEDFQKLKGKQLAEKGEFKAFYTFLTDIFRVYVGELTTVSTLEMTSSEILELTERLKLETKINSEIHSLLTLSDLVKFAKEIPTFSQAEEHFTFAIEIVNSIENSLAKRTRGETKNEQNLPET